MRRVLPSLVCLEAFEAVSRLGQVTRAADELGRTQSAVSRQVANLEAFAKRPLFTRDRKRLTLTPAGESFSQAVSRLLDQLEAETAWMIRTGSEDRSLTIGVTPAFGSRWLVPRLGGFPAAELGIDLNIVTGTAPFDVDKRGIDLAVRYGLGDWPEVDSDELVADEIVAVAAPSALRTFGGKISELQWLHMTIRPDDWAIWTRSRSERETFKPGLKFQSFTMLIEAACLGIGAAVLPVMYAKEELASGRLVAPFGPPLATGRSFWLIHSPETPKRATVEQFRNWLLTTR